MDKQQHVEASIETAFLLRRTETENKRKDDVLLYTRLCEEDDKTSSATSSVMKN